MQDFKQLADVIEVQAGGGLVEQVERLAGLPLRELLGELHALGFAAGKRSGGLAEMDVAQAHVDQRLQFLVDSGGRPAESARRLRWGVQGCRRWNSR